MLKIISTIFLFVFSFHSLYASSHSDFERNWRDKFSVSFNGEDLDVNSWFKENLDVISIEKQQEIKRDHKRIRFSPNISASQLIFIYTVGEEVKTFSLDFGKIFVSGKSFLNFPILGIRNLLDESDSMPGKDLIRASKACLENNFRAIDIPESDHSEAATLIYMNKDFSGLFKLFTDSIDSCHSDVILQGIILQVLTLNDTCNQCLRMFNSFVNHGQKFFLSKQTGVNFSRNFSSIVLSSGRKEYYYSERNPEGGEIEVYTRGGYVKNTDPILIKQTEQHNAVYVTLQHSIEFDS